MNRQNGKKLCACGLAMLLFAVSLLPAGASDLSLSAHDGTVSVILADSVKILTGFAPGETLAAAAERFDCRDHMLFMNMDGEVLTDGAALLYTGVPVLVTDGDQVLDVGVFAVWGDLDGNGAATTADARRILRAATRLEELGALPAAAADCNADGRVNTTDARLALRAAVGLADLDNQIGAVPDDSEPVAIYAYYTGEDPQAGTRLSVESIKVIAVYSDARYAVVTDAFTVAPEDLTSAVPGEAVFTVTWRDLSCEMRVTFTAREAESYYPDSFVPDYDTFAGVQYTKVYHQIDYIAYTYTAERNITDYILFESYLSYLESCGFTCTQKSVDSRMVGALYANLAQNAAVAVIYDFGMKQIIIAVGSG